MLGFKLLSRINAGHWIISHPFILIIIGSWIKTDFSFSLYQSLFYILTFIINLVHPLVLLFIHASQISKAMQTEPKHKWGFIRSIAIIIFDLLNFSFKNQFCWYFPYPGNFAQCSGVNFRFLKQIFIILLNYNWCIKNTRAMQIWINKKSFHLFDLWGKNLMIFIGLNTRQSIADSQRLNLHQRIKNRKKTWISISSKKCMKKRK